MEKRHTVLCVDDEKNILSALRRLLRKENYDLLTASSAQEALSMLESHTVHLVMADQRMPEMSGTELFEKIRDNYPDVIRIVLTGYTEIDAITGAINKGNIYKFFLKPWNDETLILEIRKALDQYDLIQLNRELTTTITRKNEELKRANDTLEQKVKERTHQLELRNQALELSRTILDQLPYPVIGIDNEGFIVMVNQQASGLSNDTGQIVIGDHLCSFFSEALEQMAIMAITDCRHCAGTEIQIRDALYGADIFPLTGRFSNQGAVLILSLK